jgi:hypothetical protein
MRHWNSARRASAVCASTLGLLAGSCAVAPEPAPRRTLRIAATFLLVGDPVRETLARAIHASLPDVDVRLQRTERVAHNLGAPAIPDRLGFLGAVQRGEVDIALSGADAVYLASVGGLEGQGALFDRLRGIALLQTRPMYLLVRPGSPVASVEALRGHRIGLGSRDSGNGVVSRLVLEAFGLNDGDFEWVPLGTAERVKHVADGAVDATFLVDAYPSSDVMGARRRGARLLPVAGHAVDRLRHDYPFFRPFVISAVAREDVAVQTVGLDTMLLCRSDLDEALVHAVTKAFFGALPELSSLEPSFRYVDLLQAPATPIPLHAGAALYYRERELAR